MRSIARAEKLFAQEENAFFTITLSWSARSKGNYLDPNGGRRVGAAHLSSGSSLAASFLCDFRVSFVKRRVKEFRIKLWDFSKG